MNPRPSILIATERPFLVLLLSLTLANLVIASSSLAAPGDLDPTFGNGGIVTTNFTTNRDEANGVALQADGKIVAVGSSFVAPNSSDFALARYNSDGTPDSSFGNNGTVTTDFDNGADIAAGVAIQSDGKIVVAGQSQVGSETDFVLSRYDTDGTLDTTFGIGGKVRSQLIPSGQSAVNTFGKAIAIQVDGKIIVAGFTDSDFAIARYLADGTLDATFGNAGWATTAFSLPGAEATAILLQTDGKIVLGGSANSSLNPSKDFALARYDADGTLDATFGPDGAGTVTTDFYGNADFIYALAAQADGSIVAAGATYSADNATSVFALARYSTDGILDDSFGTNGFTTTSFSTGVDVARGVLVQPSGMIIAAGGENEGFGLGDAALARYNSDGSLDQTFGNGGKVVTSITSTDDDGYNAILAQPDGKVVVAGYGESDPAFVVARYLAAGAQSLNISTRADVGTGEDVLIGGFIVTGTAPKEVILRAIGPSLTLTGVLADPVLSLHEPDGTVITNDNWRDTQEQQIIATGLQPSSDLESAIVATLDPGSYTAIVSGKNGGTGIALVEVYDLDQSAPSILENISTRGAVGAGDNVVIGGFILGNTQTDATIVIRGLGPSLSSEGITDFLADPVLTLYDANGNVLESDDNWKDSQESELEALNLAPTNDSEAAIVTTLAPGAYTAILEGKSGASGVGLVEVYNLP